MENRIVKIKEYILHQLLDDQSVHIDNQTALISSGIIDSISTLKLVDFLEKEFNIEFQPHEVDKDNLDNLELINTFIQSKLP